MEFHRKSKGLLTILENWGVSLAVAGGFAAVQVLMLFQRLSGGWRIGLFIMGLALLTVGTGLMGYAKFPVWRSGRFLPFGIRSVPDPLRGFYRWGRRAFWTGAVLSYFLVLSR